MKIEAAMEKFCEYSKYIRGYSEPTIRRYREGVKRLCVFAGIDELEAVTDEKVKEFFYYGRIERNWNANTFITYHKSLVVFFRWCKEHKYMENDPMADIELPRVPKRLPPRLTKQDAMKLLEIIYNYPYKYRFLRYRNHAIFSVFLFTGLRRKELLSLRCTDVDLQNMTLFVNQGKGGKDRIIPMPSTLVESLSRYVSERERLHKTCPAFFTSLGRNGAFTDSGLKRLVEALQNALGSRFNVHKLRHTFATLMLQGGCDIFSLSKMMGHSDIKTTTIYLAASPEHLRSQMVKHPLNSM